MGEGTDVAAPNWSSLPVAEAGRRGTCSAWGEPSELLVALSSKGTTLDVALDMLPALASFTA